MWPIDRRCLESKESVNQHTGKKNKTSGPFILVHETDQTRSAEAEKYSSIRRVCLELMHGIKYRNWNKGSGSGIGLGLGLRSPLSLFPR